MKDTRICDNCGAEHPISKMFEVEGDWLCEDCVDRLTVTCDRCGDRIYQESAIEETPSQILCKPLRRCKIEI